jgi:hypothetical protein
MTDALNKFAALAARAQADGVDMTKAKAGGGDDFPVPVEGPCRLRFVEYIEVGKHTDEYMGKPKIVERAYLTFEISGPKHPPVTLQDGTKVPHKVTFDIGISANEKSHFFKLFNRLNYAGKFRHIVGLLGSAYKGTLIHRKYAKRGEDKAKPETWTGVAVELFNKATSSFTIEAPRYEVVTEEGPTGDFAELKVDPPISPLRAFVWNYADKEMWDSIFIDGEYPERKDDKGVVTAPAKSKNKYQLEIKAANNFPGSPIAVILAGGDEPGKVDIPDAEDARTGSVPAGDPLEGVA